MQTFGSADEVLDFAIEREKEAAAFYTDLAGRMRNPEMQKVFAGFAREEEGHRAKLQQVKEGKRMVKTAAKVQDLKIADYIVETEPKPDMEYRDALVLAMQKEKAAFKLYTALAGSSNDDALKTLFLSLAQEEAKHKLRFELEYDDNVLTWN